MFVVAGFTSRSGVCSTSNVTNQDEERKVLIINTLPVITCPY